jgi:hypothetical protein
MKSYPPLRIRFTDLLVTFNALSVLRKHGIDTTLVSSTELFFYNTAERTLAFTILRKFNIPTI